MNKHFENEKMENMNGLIPLSTLKVDEKGVVRRYAGHGEIHGRLREIGLVRGTIVEVKRFAPLGDPMELLVRGYRLAVRKSDAAGIFVEKVISK